MKSSKAKRAPVVETDAGSFQVVWVEKYKSTLKRRDQRQIDAAHLRGQIDEDMYDAANWWWNLAYTAHLGGNVQSQLGRLNSVRSSGARVYSNKEVEARAILKKVREFVVAEYGQVAHDLLEGFVVYDCSIREFSELTGNTNRATLSVLLKRTLKTLFENQHLFSR